MVFVLIFAIASLGLAVFLIGEAATLPARERYGSIRRAATYGKSRRPSSGRPEESFGARVVDPMKLSLAHGVLKVNPRMTVEAVSARLMGAGLGRVISPTTFLASKAAAAIGGVVGGLIVGGVVGGAFPILLAASSRSSASCSRTWSCPSRHAPGATRSGPRCRTRSTSSRSVWRPVSASTPRSRS
jgi:hypothetical protein